jgi:hypothetical protein
MKKNLQNLMAVALGASLVFAACSEKSNLDEKMMDELCGVYPVEIYTDFFMPGYPETPEVIVENAPRKNGVKTNDEGMLTATANVTREGSNFRMSVTFQPFGNLSIVLSDLAALPADKAQNPENVKGFIFKIRQQTINLLGVSTDVAGYTPPLEEEDSIVKDAHGIIAKRLDEKALIMFIQGATGLMTGMRLIIASEGSITNEGSTSPSINALIK